MPKEKEHPAEPVHVLNINEDIKLYITWVCVCVCFNTLYVYVNVYVRMYVCMHVWKLYLFVYHR